MERQPAGPIWFWLGMVAALFCLLVWWAGNFSKNDAPFMTEIFLGAGVLDSAGNRNRQWLSGIGFALVALLWFFHKGGH